MLEGNSSFPWLCCYQGTPEIKLLQGPCQHPVTPGVRVSKTSLAAERGGCTDSPQPTRVEGQQHPCSLPAPVALCQGNPKNQPMGTGLFAGWISPAEGFVLAELSIFMSLLYVAACLPGPHSHSSPGFAPLHRHPRRSSAVARVSGRLAGVRCSRKMAFPEHSELEEEAAGATSCYGIN